ncbi:MAG: NusA N-terminal domain-containing protein, partial [Angelakisella sp.]
MNNEFFEALTLMEKEKGIPAEYLVEKIKIAIGIAVKKDPAGSEDNIVEIDPETKKFYVAMRKLVVEEIEDNLTEITLDAALKVNKRAKVGDIVEIPLEPKKFGRIAAQSAKHVIRQGIREAEKGLLLQEYQ